MAKARRESISIDKAVATAQAEITARLEQLAPKFREAAARAEALAKTRKALYRHMADPYGVRALVRQLKSERVRKPRTRPQVEIALRVLNELYSEPIPGAVLVKTLQGQIAARLGPTEKVPSWDTIKRARALHRR